MSAAARSSAARRRARRIAPRAPRRHVATSTTLLALGVLVAAMRARGAGAAALGCVVALRVRVCELDEVVPGELRAFTVRGVTWPIMMTIVDGDLFAFQGVCPHDDVSLADYGAIAGAEVTCRVHGYRFDVRSGQCEHAPRLHLRRYPITLVGREIWVDLL